MTEEELARVIDFPEKNGVVLFELDDPSFYSVCFLRYLS